MVGWEQAMWERSGGREGHRNGTKRDGEGEGEGRSNFKRGIQIKKSK